MLPNQQKRDLKEEHDIMDGLDEDCPLAEIEQQPFFAAVDEEPPVFRDPLGDYCDQNSFNIIQFLAENDTPSQSPADASMRAAAVGNNNGAMGVQMNAAMHGAGGGEVMMVNANGQILAGVQASQRYHHATTAPQPHGAGNTGRLPESPPVTDISGANSSASPSSNSESPFSPENYSAYAAHQHLNNNGLILGVADLGMIDALPQTVMVRAGGNSASVQQPNTPQHQMYMGQYPNSIQQISPEAPQSHRSNSGYGMPGRVGSSGASSAYNEIYNEMLGGSVQPSDPSPEPCSRKRQRLDHIAAAPSQIQYVNAARQRAAQPDARQYAAAAHGNLSMAASPVGGESYMDENFHQGGEVIKFNKFQEETWFKLYDENRRELSQMAVHVVADKGFNYSHVDGCFVNQKKNHFQISVNIEANDDWPARFVHINGHLHPITEMKLAFAGVKSEMPSSEIQIKQSQTDRKPIPHDPVVIVIPPRQLTKATVPRLHFSETTMNNQRKNSRPNPDQKFFLLVVRLLAVTEDGAMHCVQAYASEKVIVRATNPGQFEPPDSDVSWMKNGQTMYCNSPVAIGAERPAIPNAMLTVSGDIYHVGQMLNPSDLRLKEDINEISPDDAVERLGKFRIVEYSYKPEIAKKWGITEQARHRVGVIAQELAEIIPEAVKKEGEFLTVDESRMFYDNIVATQELCRLHGDLEDKIDGEVESIQETLSRIFRRKQEDNAKKLSPIAEASSLAETKTFISNSRYSLNSTFKKKLASNPYCRCQHDQFGSPHVCNSRITQGTIVTLVIIMAVCLLSMSTLYVLDWHNRNYGVHPIMPPTPVPPTLSSTDGVGYMKQNQALPLKQPLAPPLHAVCLNKHCQTFCCEDHYSIGDEPVLKNSTLLASLPLTAQQRFLAAAIGSPELSPKAWSPKPLQTGVRITLNQHNMTIDERYCHERSCSARRGRYTLYIPISPYLPSSQIQLQFHVPIGRSVSNCGHLSDFKEQYCNSESYKVVRPKSPSSSQLNKNLFGLSAGLYMKSAYRFRVSDTGESCYSKEEADNYEEYNLIFYRTCAIHAHLTTTTTTATTMNVLVKK